MAKKLSENELENVSGGCGYVRHCSYCDKNVSGDWWKATYKDPTTGKTKRVSMCKKCADKNFNDPNFSDWQFDKCLD